MTRKVTVQGSGRQLTAETVRVVASTGGGNTSAPPPPWNVAAVALSPTEVQLSWTAKPRTTYVEVYRDGEFLASSLVRGSYTDATAEGSTTYEYALKACNVAGCSALTAAVSVTTPADEEPPPDLEGTPIPAGASIQAYLSAGAVGEVFALAGTVEAPVRYRITAQLNPKQDQEINGTRGSIISGAKLLVGWTYDAPNTRWYHAGDTTPQSSLPGGGNTPQEAKYPDDVWRDDVRLTRVLSLGALATGKAYIDYTANRVYVKDDPASARMELSAAWIAFNNNVPGVKLTGFVVEKVACVAQQPALRVGTGWVVDDLEIRWNHGVGINNIGTGSITKNSYIHHQGQLGMSGSSGIGVQITDNEIAYNNQAGYDPYWEAGGAKWTDTQDLDCTGNESHHNAGPGLWTDIDNIRVLYDLNHCHDNGPVNGVGIFHEISYDAVIRNNDCHDNTDRSIYVSSSGGVGTGIIDVYGNTVDVPITATNGEGITVGQENRPGGKYGPTICRNVKVHDNTIRMCRGTSGAFQVPGSPGNPFANGNTWEDNHYIVDDAKATWWKWLGSERTFAAWQGYGHDLAGDSVTTPC